jgi:protein arginine phosphatase
MAGGPTIVTLCTGNAARSVMAGAALERHLPHVEVRTAGTLVVEGQPMSWRTRDALAALGLSVPHHRSRQAGPWVASAELVLAMAPEHVAWVRRTHPDAAARTITLKRLARDLPLVPGALAERLAALDLAASEPEAWEEVVDPGGGDAEVFAACASEVAALVEAAAPALLDAVGAPEPA